jgi:hypothetical protein
MIFHKEKAVSPGSHLPLSRLLQLAVCFAELFSDLVDDDSPLVLTELFFNFLAVECFQGPHESFIKGLHFVTVVGGGGGWGNDVIMILSS